MELLVRGNEAVHGATVSLEPDLRELVWGVEEFDSHIVERPGRDPGIGLGIAEVAVGRQRTLAESVDVVAILGRKVEGAEIVIERAVLHHHEHDVLDLFLTH
jgi:hypothetical protein